MNIKTVYKFEFTQNQKVYEAMRQGTKIVYQNQRRDPYELCSTPVIDNLKDAINLFNRLYYGIQTIPAPYIDVRTVTIIDGIEYINEENCNITEEFKAIVNTNTDSMYDLFQTPEQRKKYGIQAPEQIEEQAQTMRTEPYKPCQVIKKSFTFKIA